MRTLPWPRLLLVSLFVTTLGTALLLVTWDPRTRPEDLEVTSAEVDRYEQRCTRSTAGPVGGPPMCHNVVYFRSSQGREFFFPYADEMRGPRGQDPIVLGHSHGGEIWFVRQGPLMVASYDEVRELRSQDARTGRFLGLLGCLAIVVVGGRFGVLRLRAGPPCPSPLCRVLDYVTVGAVAVAVVAITRRDLTLAMGATAGIFLPFVAGIAWASWRGHIDGGAFETRLLSGELADRTREAGEKFARWSARLTPPKDGLSLPWRIIASICDGWVVLGFLTMLGSSLSTLVFLVIPGANDPQAWRVMTRLFMVGAALVVVAGLVGRIIRRIAAGGDGRSWLAWTLLSLPLLLLVSALT